MEEKYPGKFYGYYLLCGSNTEWLSDGSHEAPSPLTEQAFRAWCGKAVPDKASRETDKNVVFLDPEKDETLIQYRHFANWQRADTILMILRSRCWATTSTAKMQLWHIKRKKVAPSPYFPNWVV